MKKISNIKFQISNNYQYFKKKQLEIANWKLEIPRKSGAGFTLIELLVVIAIIGLLVAIGVGSYPSILASARDNTRKHDLRQLATALAVYSQDHAGLFVNGSGTCEEDTEAFYEAIDTYMAQGKVPVDPKTKTQYCYQAVGDGTSFMLKAVLENCNDASILDKAACKNNPTAYNVIYDSASANPLLPPPAEATLTPTITPVGPGSGPTATPTVTPTATLVYVDNDMGTAPARVQALQRVLLVKPA